MNGVDGLDGEVVKGVVWKVKMYCNINLFLVNDVGSVVVESGVELGGGHSYVLFLAFSSCDEVDKVC